MTSKSLAKVEAWLVISSGAHERHNDLPAYHDPWICTLVPSNMGRLTHLGELFSLVGSMHLMQIASANGDLWGKYDITRSSFRGYLLAELRLD